ncbi:MAG TPA: hypothetical protein VMT43_10930, partial [Acidimicrobiales bacterium]|nr:hypothetical protein [Acidimicrobiales bacterium]
MASPTPTSRWRSTVRPTRRVVLVAVLAAVVATALVLAWRATRSPGFDRALAVDRAVDASGGRLTRGQAGCYVDHVRAKIGSRYLEPDVTVPGPIAARMAAMRDDCIGVAGLGLSTPSTASVPGTEAGSQPLRHGQDPVLDALWARCAAGDGAACDELFDQSPIGSEYERFALTCGGRTPQMACATVYHRPRPTTNAPRSTTTSAPAGRATTTTARR